MALKTPTTFYVSVCSAQEMNGPWHRIKWLFFSCWLRRAGLSRAGSNNSWWWGFQTHTHTLRLDCGTSMEDRPRSESVSIFSPVAIYPYILRFHYYFPTSESIPIG